MKPWPRSSSTARNGLAHRRRRTKPVSAAGLTRAATSVGPRRCNMPLRMKLRKIRYRTVKFFGHKKDRWARLGGRWGKRRSYGHYSEYPDGRTRAELRDCDDRADAIMQLEGTGCLNHRSSVGSAGVRF